MSYFVLLGLGGALGALARSLSLLLLKSYFVSPFLSSTLPVNTLGCFFAGVLYPLLLNFPPALSGGLLIGFLGAYTTFSSFSLEILQALERGQPGFALLYGVLSNFLALFACYLGYCLALSVKSFL